MSVFVLRPGYGRVKPVISRSERQINAAISALSVTLVVFAQGVWLLMVGLELEPGRDSPASVRIVPEVAFMGAPSAELGGGLAGDVRVIGSPTLLSLPMRVGFSQPLFAGAEVSDPPEIRGKPVVFMYQPDEPFRSGVFGETTRLFSDVINTPRAISLPPIAEESVAFMPTRRTAPRELLIYWQERPNDVMNLSALLGEADWTGTLPWEAVLSICFDDKGMIQQVIADRPAPTKEIGAALARWCRGIDFDKLPADPCGRLVVVFKPEIVASGG